MRIFRKSNTVHRERVLVGSSERHGVGVTIDTVPQRAHEVTIVLLCNGVGDKHNYHVTLTHAEAAQVANALRRYLPDGAK